MTARECFERAKRLGYMKLEFEGPLVGSWERYCYDQAIPCVVLYPRGRLWRLIYWQPAHDPFVLTDRAVARLQAQADRSRSPRASSVNSIGAQIGEVGGLLPDQAEALAFAVSEALNDPAQLRHSGEEND